MGGRSDTVDADEIIACIAGTKHRARILSVLSTESLDIRDLSDEIGVPRTTLRHNLEKMEDANLITETLDRTYTLTPLGEATLAGLRAFRKRIETEARLEPLFSCIPASKFDFDISAFEGATVTVARRACPFLPAKTLLEALVDGDDVVAALPSLPASASEMLFKDSREARPNVELLITPQVANVLVEEFSVRPEVIHEDDGIRVAVTNHEPEHGVAIVDDRAYIQGFDDEQKPHVLVQSDDPRCRDWVTSKLETYRTDSVPIHDREDATAVSP